MRPTPDRVRETLFNWLQPYIDGAVCLDLYAGSGVLGFEALSRGAAQTVMVEQDRLSVTNLERHATILGAQSCQVINNDAVRFLNEQYKQYNLVFLDPPFGKNLLLKACEILKNKGHLQPGARVYVESESEFVPPQPYTIEKQGRVGNVHFALLVSD